MKMNGAHHRAKHDIASRAANPRAGTSTGLNGSTAELDTHHDELDHQVSFMPFIPSMIRIVEAREQFSECSPQLIPDFRRNPLSAR